MVITVTDASGIKCQAGEFSLLVDSPPKRKGNLILRTRTPLPVDSFAEENVVFGPGEYEIEGVRARGIALGSDNSKEIRSIYSAELDGIKIAFLLDINSDVSEDSIDKLGEVDILFISADDKKVKSKQIISLIRQVDPSVIIPVSDKTAKTLMEEMGKKVKADEKFTVKKSDLIKEDMANKLVWLKTK